MLGIYFSGTGNTKHCVEKLTHLLDKTAKVLPLESEEILCQIKENEIIILGYPTQYSNAPFMVRDFILSHDKIWKEKKILCVEKEGICNFGRSAYSYARFRMRCQITEKTA